MQHEMAVHAGIEGHLHGLDAVVAAVRVTGGVALAHAQHQMADVFAVGPGRGVHDEQQVAARHEGVGDAFAFLLDGHVRGQGRVGQLAEQADVQQGVGPQTVLPFRLEGRDGAADLAAAFQFHGVALAVIEAQRMDAGKAGKGPGKAGGRILAAGKDDQGLLVGKGRLMGHDLIFPPARRGRRGPGHNRP